MRSTIRYWVVAALEVWYAANLHTQAQRERQAAADAGKEIDQVAALSRQPLNIQISPLQPLKPEL